MESVITSQPILAAGESLARYQASVEETQEEQDENEKKDDGVWGNTNVPIILAASPPSHNDAAEVGCCQGACCWCGNICCYGEDCCDCGEDCCKCDDCNCCEAGDCDCGDCDCGGCDCSCNDCTIL